MRVYYRAPDVVVTSELFVRFGTQPGRFAVRDLQQVVIDPGKPEGVRYRAVLPVAAAALVAAAVVAAGGGVLLAGAIAVSAGGAGAGYAVLQLHRPRRWELRATYRDREVVLYTSTDARVFNQVSRALRRALEEARTQLGGAAAA